MRVARRREEYAITAIRKSAISVGCAAVLLATAAACGTVQSLSAGQKVDDAVDRLGEQKSLAFRLDLDADSDALTALMGGAGSGEELPPEFAKFFTGLRVEVSVKSRKPLADSGEKDLVGTSVSVAGSEGVLVEYRVVGGALYYRADMKAVGEAMGMPMPEVDQIPESQKDLRKVLEGAWVKIDTSALEEAQKSESPAETADGADAKTQQKVIDAVRGVIAHEVAFSAKGGGDGTEHIVADASLRDLITGVLNKLGPLDGELPLGAELPTSKDLKDVPNKKVAVDFTLKNGDLTRVEIDLAAIADAPKGTELPLVLTFTDAGDVSAPSGATEIPLGEIPGGSPFAGGLLGGGEL